MVYNKFIMLISQTSFNLGIFFQYPDLSRLYSQVSSKPLFPAVFKVYTVGNYLVANRFWYGRSVTALQDSSREDCKFHLLANQFLYGRSVTALR